jgi:hypothetical protein
MVESKTYLPNEISNIICSYIQGPTHKIMQDLYFDPIACLKLNKTYNFKHLNIPRLLDAIHRRCPHCHNSLKPQEYLYRGTYEMVSMNRLCFDCLEKEKFRIFFELSELCILLIIYTIVWISITYMTLVLRS